MLSPKFENLDLSSIGSPRFDISEFLRTPKSPQDGSGDDSLYDLPEFDTSSPTFNSLSLPSFGSNKMPKQESDSHSLLVDGKGDDTESLTLDAALNGDLMCFDNFTDAPVDPLSISNNSDCDLTNSCPVPLSAIPPCPQESEFPSMGIPPSMFEQYPPYLGTEPGGLLEVEERALASMEQGISTMNGMNSLIFSNNLMDWGMPQSEMQAPLQQCESCQLMRRIIHSNGFQDTKLELHCDEGKNYHANFQTRYCIDGNPSNLTQQRIEFPVANAEYMKHFLMEYSLLRRNEGFVLRHDSLMIHTDMGMGMSIISDQFFPGPLGQHPNQTAFNNSQLYGNLSHGQCQMLQNNGIDQTAGSHPKPKSNVAAQRERTGKIKMSDLAQFFHLPINVAAKGLGICPTVLKKICRRNGMRRWPHRKIKSIERIIATLEQTIAQGNGQGDQNIRTEIAMLRKERDQLCAGLVGGSK